MLNESKILSFLSVAKHNSFTKAADELYTTRQSISRQIKTLEEDMGTSLFIRGSNQVGLSENGRLCYEVFSKQFLELENLRRRIKMDADKRINARIGIVMGIEIKGAAANLLEVIKSASGLADVELVRYPREQIGSAYRSVEVDFAIGFPRQIFEDADAVKADTGCACVIGGGELVMSVSKSHPMASEYAEISDFSDETFLTFTNTGEQALVNILRKNGINPTRFKPCPNIESAVTELLHNNKVLVSSCELDLIQQRDIITFSLGQFVELICAWHKREPRPAMRRLISHLRREFPGYVPEAADSGLG